MWRLSLAALALLTTGATTMLVPADPIQVPAAVPPAAASVTQVPVLLYHHLMPGAGGDNGAVVAVEAFEEQMAWLKAEGYAAITTAQLRAWLGGKSMLPAKPVLITFDDGYRSNYEHGYPVLRRHGLRAAIFMVSGYAGQKNGDFEYLSFPEMQEMERSGLIELQAHTHDGHRQIDGVPALRVWTDAEIRTDARTLRQTFAETGLKPPAALAYPFGAYDAEAIRALTGEGIELGFTVRHGHVRRGDPLMELKRLTIFPGTSLCQFGALVEGRPAGAC